MCFPVARFALETSATYRLRTEWLCTSSRSLFALAESRAVARSVLDEAVAEATAPARDGGATDGPKHAAHGREFHGELARLAHGATSRDVQAGAPSPGRDEPVVQFFHRGRDSRALLRGGRDGRGGR